MKKIRFLTIIVILFTIKLQAQHNNDTTVSFKVFGVCEQCKHRIEGALKIKGIGTAEWNIDSKLLTVSYNPSKISLEKINNKITAVGHDTYYKKAKDMDYTALPACCHYRELKSMDDDAKLQADTAANIRISDSAGIKPPESTFETVKGIVLEETSKGEFKPLAGASVIWLGTNIGTVTDESGIFNLKQKGQRLAISY